MVIDEKILISCGAEYISYSTGELIFKESGMPDYYYQVSKGSVKLFNKVSFSKEFIQSVSTKGDCVGVLSLFSDQPYATDAEALESTVIIRLPRKKFMLLLQKYTSCATNLLTFSAKSLNYCNIIMCSMSQKDPVALLLALFSYLKKQNMYLPTEIPFTRKQIASLTGLRTETVIRTVKQMDNQAQLKIIKGKIHF